MSQISHASFKSAFLSPRPLDVTLSGLEEGAPQLDGESRFLSLSNWYAEAANVSMEQLYGWSSGRCYNQDLPNLAINGLMAYVTVTPENNEGPAFPAPVKEYIILGTHHNESGKALPSDYFDNYDSINDPESIDGFLKQSVAGGQFSQAKVQDANSTVEWYADIEKNGNLDIKASVKKHGEYFVVEVSNLIKNNPIYSESSGKVIKHKVGPIAYCYYFRKIKN